MASQDEMLAEIKRLRQEQEDHGEIIQSLLRHNGRELKSELLSFLRKNPIAAEILVRVDGVKSQGEILAAVQGLGLPNSNAMTVSRRIRQLAHDHHLIVLVERTGAGNVYRRTMLEKTLGICRELEKTRRP